MVEVGAFTTLFAGLGSGAAIASAVLAVTINLVIASVLGKLLAPDVPSNSRDTKGLQNTIRSNVAPRRVIYGEAVTGGPYALLETTGTDNAILNMIVLLAGHPIEDVLGVFIEDEYVNIAGPGGATNTSSGTNDLDSNYVLDSGKFGTNAAAGHVKIIKNLGWGYADFNYVNNHLGSDAADDRSRATLISNELATLWTNPSNVRDSGTGLYASGNKLTNCAHIYISVKFNRDVWAGFPNIKFHVKGKRLYNPALDPAFVAEGADSSGTHDLTDPDTWEWSEDWTLCVLDYLLNTEYGLAAKISGNLTELDWTEAISSYYSSSELITTGLPSPFDGTSERYTINGVFEVSSTPISNMEALLNSGGGELIYAQGKYKIRPAVYRFPDSESDVINEDMIVSPLGIRTHTPRSDIFNKAGGVFVDIGYDTSLAPSSVNQPLFEPSDFDIVDPLDSSGLNPYEVIDDEEIIKEFDFPFTNKEFEAQRLARIQLERVRRGFSVSFEANLKVLKFSVGDTVYLEILNNSKYANESFFNRLGLDDQIQNRPNSPGTLYYKQFKIIDMQYTENFTIAVTMVEEAEEIYEWNNGFASKSDNALISDLVVDDPTGVVLPASWDVPSPNLNIQEITTGPDIITYFKWVAPERGSLVNAVDKAHIHSYRLEYGIVTNPSETGAARVDDWIYGATIIANPGNSIQGPVSLPNLYITQTIDYDFRILATTYSGRSSVWAYYSEFAGSDFTPSAPAGATRYYIKPTNGTAIKNGIGTLTVEARIVNAISDTLLSSGTIQLYVNGSTLVSVGNGFASPSDGYTGTFDTGDINGDEVVELRDGPAGALYDTITLVDVLDGAAADSGVNGYIEPSNGLAWTRAPTAGAWTPSTLTTDLDCTFVKGGVEVSRIARRITLTEATGILDVTTTTHKGGNLNTGDVTVILTNDSTTAVSVQFDYLLSPDASSVAETVHSVQGGDRGFSSIILDTKDWVTPRTDPMGEWYLGTGVISNTSTVTSQAGPFNEYPFTMRLRGDGTPLGWYSQWRHDHVYDKDKSYVYYAWVNRVSANSTEGLYLGFRTAAASSEVVNLAGGAASTNPYFVTNVGSVLTEDKWYLAVGIIYPDGYAGTDQDIAGIYDPDDGAQVYNGTEFEWNGQQETENYLRIGFFENESPGFTSTDGFLFTRIVGFIRDGSEPSIETMLNLAAQPGVDALSSYLTNTAHTVATNSDGTGYSLTGSGGTHKVFSGQTDVTATATHSVASPDTKNGLTISVNSSGVYSLSGSGDSWTSDNETFTLIATYASVDLESIYTITKSKAGTSAPIQKITAVGDNAGNIVVDPANAEAALQMNNDGDLYSREGTGSSFTSVGTWLNTGTNSDYEYMFEGTGDTPTGASVNTWIAGNTTSAWTLQEGTVSNSKTFDGTLKWRDATTLEILGQASSRILVSVVV